MQFTLPSFVQKNFLYPKLELIWYMYTFNIGTEIFFLLVHLIKVSVDFQGLFIGV